MKSWKKRWKDELAEITPDLRDDVKNIPIPTIENIENNGGNTAVLSISKQKLIPIVTAVFAIILCAVLLCVFLIKPNKTYSDFLFTLEINPAVTMSADENGIVTGVIASNADADIILSDENVQNQIRGKSIAEAITYYTDCAAKLGYIDLEQKGSAVRISGLGDEDCLGKAQTALETYFTDKGLFVVVVVENVNKDEFSKRSGITAEDAAKYIKDSTVLFSDRIAENLSLQDLKALYNELVIENKLFNQVNESLADNIERIIQNAEDIAELSQLYMDIFHHKDNPTSFGDYWMIKKLYGNTLLSGDFADLMTQMDTALERYKTNYGVEITNVSELTAATNSYLKISTNMLAEFAKHFTFDLFKQFTDDITEILQITGLITGDFANYLQVPQSFAEYVEKTTALINSEYKSRLETYENLYNKYRPPIEKTDYDSFIESIVQQYGSLNAYWQAIKN